MNDGYNVMVGGDPEYLITDLKGTPVPAHRFGIPYIKSEKVDSSDGQYGRDGYALETNPTPARCRAYLSQSNKRILKEVEARLGPQYRIIGRSSWPVSKADLKDAPEDVLSFGCSPSMDAYTEDWKMTEIHPLTPFRFAGGHFHYGSLRETDGYYQPVRSLTDKKFHPRLVRLMDLFIGIPEVVIFGGTDAVIRRKYYGRAGEYRSHTYGMQSVGVEYRVPGSEAWNHQAIVGMFSGVGRYLAYDFKDYEKYDDKARWADVQNAINTGEGAEALLQTMPRFYDPETILALKKVVEIRSQFMTNPLAPEAHTGWAEYAHRWNLPGKNVESFS